MKQDVFEVLEEQEGERLDKYLSIIYPDISRSFFQKIIKDNMVLVNDQPQKANYRLRDEDIVTINFPDAVTTAIEPEDIPLDILYEDEDLLVVNKPKGMVVHPSAGHYTHTLVNAIMADAEVSNKSIVFNTADPDFSEEKIFNSIRNMCDGVTRIVPITAGTLKMAYEYFSTKIVEIKKHKANDVVGMFYEFIKRGSECFVKNGKIYFSNYAPVSVDETKANQFLRRFGEFDENDKSELDRMYDTLVSDTERRVNGQFFTPKVWVDEAHRRMALVVGEDWESKYPSWSCCCGTKSCSRDYEYGSLWLSTLEQSELNASSSLNTEAVDTFVFDFLNDSESKLPKSLKDALKKAGKEGTPFTMLINPPYGQSGANKSDKNNSKTGISDTEIGREMKSVGLGKAANELTVQFLFRIMNIVKEYGIKDFTLGLFSNPAWMTGDACEKFREEWNKVATFVNGFAFHSDEFEGVKEGWAINFSVWKLSA